MQTHMKLLFSDVHVYKCRYVVRTNFDIQTVTSGMLPPSSVSTSKVPGKQKQKHLGTVSEIQVECAEVEPPARNVSEHRGSYVDLNVTNMRCEHNLMKCLCWATLYLSLSLWNQAEQENFSMLT